MYITFYTFKAGLLIDWNLCKTLLEKTCMQIPIEYNLEEQSATTALISSIL